LASSKIRILRSFRSKKGFKTFLVLRPQFFKSLRPSKVKTRPRPLWPKPRPRPQKMVLRPRPILRTTSLHWLYNYMTKAIKIAKSTCCSKTRGNISIDVFDSCSIRVRFIPLGFRTSKFKITCFSVYVSLALDFVIEALKSSFYAPKIT